MRKDASGLKDAVDRIIMTNIRARSNFDLTSSYLDRQVDYGELWFWCQKCNDPWPAEWMYFVQKFQSADAHEVILQNLSTFFVMRPDQMLHGLDEDFDSEKSIVFVCSRCLEQEGVDTSEVPVAHIPTVKKRWV